MTTNFHHPPPALARSARSIFSVAGTCHSIRERKCRTILTFVPHSRVVPAARPAEERTAASPKTTAGGHVADIKGNIEAGFRCWK